MRPPLRRSAGPSSIAATAAASTSLAAMSPSMPTGLDSLTARRPCSDALPTATARSVNDSVRAGDSDVRACGERDSGAGLAGHGAVQRPQVGGGRFHLQAAGRRVVAARMQHPLDRHREAAGRGQAIDANIAVERSGG